MTEKKYDLKGNEVLDDNTFSLTKEALIAHYLENMEKTDNYERKLELYREAKGIVYKTYSDESTEFIDNALKVIDGRFNENKINKSKLQALSDVIQKQMNFDFDFMKACNELVNEYPLYYDESGTWWMFIQNKWKIVDDVDIFTIISDNVRINNLLKNNAHAPFFKALKITARKNKPIFLDKEWIQFDDEVFNYLTGERKVLTKEYFINNPLPVKLGSDKPTPFIDKLLVDWVGVEKAETLKDIIAYCFVRSYPIQRIFAFLGSGRNGKGSFIRLLRLLLGKDNVTSSSLDSINNNRFESSSLFKKLLCDVSETNTKTLNKSDFIKKMCGGDDINAEFKGKNKFIFLNYAKLIVCSNSLPETLDKTNGFYRRWLIIDFPNKFPDGHEITDKVDYEELSNFAFKLAMRLKDLMQRGKFLFEPDSDEEREKVYESKSNPFQAFIDEFMVFDANVEVPKYKFDEAFNQYLRDKGYRIMSYRETSFSLKKHGFSIEKKREKGKVVAADSLNNPINHVIGLDFKVNHSKVESGLNKFIADNGNKEEVDKK